VYESPKKCGSHKKLLALCAVVIILGILLYLYETYGSLPSAVISALSSGKSPNSAVLEGILLQKINSVKTFAVSYTGRITIKKDPPISFSFEKYYNNTKVFLSIDNVSPFGNLSAVLISENPFVNLSAVPLSEKFSTHGTLCIKADPNSVFNTIESGNTTDGYGCVQTYNVSAQAQLLRILNFYVNASSLGNIVTKTYGLKLRNNQPCYFVSGNGTVEVNSLLIGANSPSQTLVNMYFDTCLSAQYSIPLNISTNMTTADGSSINIFLNESSMNQTTTHYQVDSLP
jgi:hypothetical protein